MHDATETIGLNSLHERLAPADQERLASIILEAASSAVVADDGFACIDRMRRDNLEATQRDLKLRIKAAERDGRIADAFRMMRELANLSG